MGLSFIHTYINRQILEILMTEVRMYTHCMYRYIQHVSIKNKIFSIFEPDAINMVHQNTPNM